MRRPDGVPVTNARWVERLGPYILNSKQEALIFYRQTVPVDAVFAFIDDYNRRAQAKTCTFFAVLLAAMVRVAPEFPQLGRFVVGRRLYQRTEITFSFVVKTESDHGHKNAWVTARFTGKERLRDVIGVLDAFKEKARALPSDSGGGADASLRLLFALPAFLRPLLFRGLHWLNRVNLLPRKFIEGDPLFAACIIANVGSVGLNAPFHHLYEWGTNSMFMAIGKAYPLACPHPDVGVAFRQMVDIHYTLDERAAFGTFSTEALERLQHYLEHPQELE